MVMERGEIWWANLPAPTGSAPGFRRPVLVVQSDFFNVSQIQTVIVAAISSNLNLMAAPGNVFLSASDSGLPKDSVINVSQIITVNKRLLTEKVSQLSRIKFQEVESGLRLVLSL
jgi:mRNA interferase MazF